MDVTFPLRFEDLRKAWKEAVENFWHELEEDTDQTGVHGEARKQLSAMRRELSTADSEVRRLEVEVTRARGAAATERKEEETCRRRLTMAEGIGDAETAQLARTYAERAAVLERKAEALEAEHALRTRDLAEMRDTVERAAAALGAGAQATSAGVGAGAGSNEQQPSADDLKLGDWPDPANPADADRLQRDVEFRRMQREAREKAADARLEELKKKMQ